MEVASVEQILRRARAQFRPGDYAAFDADGTLWAFDIAYALFHRLLESRALKNEAGPILSHVLRHSSVEPVGADVNQWCRQMFAAYELGHADEALTFAAAVQALAGFSLDELDEHHAQAIARTPLLPAKLFTHTRPLFLGLQHLGYRIAVVSASPLWTVAFGLRCAGLLADVVLGGETLLHEGVITDEIKPPMTYKEGKLLALREVFSTDPTLGFGDSRGDAFFLQHCEQAVFVNPKPSLLALTGRFSRAPVRLESETTEDGQGLSSPRFQVV